MWCIIWEVSRPHDRLVPDEAINAEGYIPKCLTELIYINTYYNIIPKINVFWPNWCFASILFQRERALQMFSRRSSLKNVDLIWAKRYIWRGLGSPKYRKTQNNSVNSGNRRRWFRSKIDRSCNMCSCINTHQNNNELIN